MLTVHLRINDAATGKPTPVRVRVSGPDGTQYAPLGRWIEFPAGRNECVGGQLAIVRDRWFYVDGACEIALPAGVPLQVQVAKGYEYTPLDETVTLGAGQMALRFAIRRWADSRADGWVSVDTRCHFLTPHDAILEAAAEGVDVVNLLATVQRFPSLDGTAYLTVANLAAFSGQAPALERDGRAVVVNTLNVHPVLGKVALLHSHRPVFPLAFGGEEADDWGVCDWCDQCHRKGGLVVWVDAFDPAGGVTGGEALVAAVLGKIDAIEYGAGPRKLPLMPWLYRLWDAGVRLPLAGASGKDSNHRRLGAVRTYAPVWRPNPPTPFPAREGGAESPLPPRGRGLGEGSHADWVAAVKAGKSFVGAGPLIDFGLDGTRFRASGRAGGPHGKLEVVANGQVVAAADGVADENGHVRAEVDTEVPAGWVAARWGGASGFAHSSPVAVGPVARNGEAVAAVVKLIDQTREWAEQHGRYANPKRREQLLARCAEAVARLGAEP